MDLKVTYIITLCITGLITLTLLIIALKGNLSFDSPLSLVAAMVFIAIFVLLSLRLVFKKLNIDRLNFVEENSKRIFVACVLLLIILPFANNMGEDMFSEHGSITVEKADVGFYKDLKQTGYWVYKSTGQPTGKKEYSSNFFANISIVMDKSSIKYNNSIDLSKLDNNSNKSGDVQLYDKDGNYLTKYPVDNITLKGSKIIIDEKDASRHDMDIRAAKKAKTGDVILTFKNKDFKFKLQSDKFNVTTSIETVD